MHVEAPSNHRANALALAVIVHIFILKLVSLIPYDKCYCMLMLEQNPPHFDMLPCDLLVTSSP